MAISPGPDGEYGTDEDEVEVRSRSSKDEENAADEEAASEEAPAEETEETEETATWDDGEDPWDGA